MIGQKARLLFAVVLAVLMAFLLVGMTYLVFPDRTDQMPLPMPEPLTSVQISMAIYWIGITAIVTIAIVGIFIVVQRIRRKTSEKNIAINL